MNTGTILFGSLLLLPTITIHSTHNRENNDLELSVANFDQQGQPNPLQDNETETNIRRLGCYMISGALAIGGPLLAIGSLGDPAECSLTSTVLGASVIITGTIVGSIYLMNSILDNCHRCNRRTN